MIPENAKPFRAEEFGEVLSPSQAWQYINGMNPGKTSFIGRNRIYKLMRSGAIKCVVQTGKKKRYATRKEYLNKFLDDMFIGGNKQLNIQPVSHRKIYNNAA
ncbi:MAG TPA: hypothetical protein VFA55_06160 [Candidatus Kapabacteria bacterium]|nr:hypothetical protein [Candidatus Kapabacteria bacterium]